MSTLSMAATSVAALDPSPGFRGEALAPPRSEASPYSYSHWYKIRHSACTTFRGANPCGIESDMWTMIRALVEPAHAVLEYGARYGTTSCVLAEATNNSGAVLSVEPDPAAHAALLHNRREHRCNFHIFRGTVGRTPQVLMPNYTDGRTRKVYEVRTRDARPADPPSTHIERLSLEEAEKLTGLRFNVLVVDCEGCLADVLTPAILTRQDPPLELLLLEMDVLRKVNYAEWHVRLSRHGFRRTWHVEDALFGFRAPRHVAYQRAARPTPSCIEFARRQSHWPRCVLNQRKQTYRCGSRLSCLNPEIVNGSHEHFWVEKMRGRLKDEPLLAPLNEPVEFGPMRAQLHPQGEAAGPWTRRSLSGK